MATNLTMSLDVVSKVNSQVTDSGADIKNCLTNINSLMDQLSSNVTGTTANSLINKVKTSTTEINSKMDTNFSQLTDFLQTQIGNYENAYETASEMFKQAISFIDTNFAKVG